MVVSMVLTEAKVAVALVVVERVDPAAVDHRAMLTPAVAVAVAATTVAMVDPVSLLCGTGYLLRLRQRLLRMLD